MLSLKAGKYTGEDNIPSELVKNGGEATTTVLTSTCQKIWEAKELPKEWTHSLVIPLQKKKKKKTQAMSELSYYQLNQLRQQGHAPSYPQPT